MRSRCEKMILGIIFCAAIACMAIPVRAQAQGMEPAQAGMVPGQAVGALKAQKDNGAQIDLGKYGKPYVLGFYVPGRDDIASQMETVSKLLKSKELSGFELLAVTRGKDNAEKKSARDFMKSKKFPATLVFDPKLDVAKKFGVVVFPAFFIVDKNGTVRSLSIPIVTEKIRKRSFEDFLKLVAKGEPIPYVDMVPWNDIPKDARALVGKPAADFTLPDLSKKKYMLSKYKGKNVIVIYFSPGCPHCMVELPRVQDFYINNKARYNFEVLAITRAGGKEGEKKVKEIIGEKMLTFPILLDENGAVAADYAVKSVPAAYFINKNGTMVDLVLGENPFFALIYHSIFRDPLRLGS
jgi:peroxiredoxin